MPRFPQSLIDRLFANVDADDEATPEAELPARPDFFCTAAERRDCYLLSLQMLEDYVDRRAFRALIAVIARRGRASPAEYEQFHKARACFKHMRYSCANFDARHRYPPVLHRLVALMGHFQDAILNRQRLKIIWLGSQLWLKLSPRAYARLLDGLRHCRPDTDESYKQWLEDENADLADFLESRPLRGTGPELHRLRKIISRRVALNDTLRALRPSREADNTSLWLATLNGRLGDIHDAMIRESLAGKRDYRHDIFTPPAEIERRCRLFLERQQTADSRQQTADSRQQTADSRQQTADSRQQTADRLSQNYTLSSSSSLLRLKSASAQLFKLFEIVLSLHHITNHLANLIHSIWGKFRIISESRARNPLNFYGLTLYALSSKGRFLLQ